MFKTIWVSGLAAVTLFAPVSVFADVFVIENDTTLTNGGFVVDGDDTVTLANGVTITVTGDNNQGIEGTGDNNEVISNGDISTNGLGADGILLRGEFLTITNTGTVQTSGNESQGVFAQSSDEGDITITNSGGITTFGLVSHAIEGDADEGSVTIVNSGSLWTTGNFAAGIDGEADGAVTISNSGDIVTEGEGSNGIYARTFTCQGRPLPCTDSVIENSGNISTSGERADGILNESAGGNATIINSGDITVSAFGSDAIENRGPGFLDELATALVVNSGTLTVLDPGSGIRPGYGIRQTGSGDVSAVVENNGDISVTGFQGRGIENSASEATAMVTNTANITVTGDRAYGIRNGASRGNPSELFGGDSIVFNSGTISVIGDLGNGVEFRNSSGHAYLTNLGMISTDGTSSRAIDSDVGEGNVIVENSGTISTLGNSSGGADLYTDLGDVTVFNSGSIQTSGTSSTALYAESNDGGAYLTNTGTIETTGDNSDAVEIGGDFATVTNRGTISATGSGGLAVRFFGSNSHLDLRDGSVILGEVGFGDQSTANVTFGAGLTGVVDTTSTYTGAHSSATGVSFVVDDKIYGADLGDLAGLDQVYFDYGRLVQNALDASLTSDAAFGSTAFQDGTWVRVFAENALSTGTSDGTAVNSTSVGSIFGRDLGQIGWFAGAGLSMINASSRTGQDTDAQMLFGGVYGATESLNEFSVMAGLVFNQATRTVADGGLPSGTDTASDEYLSFFVSPALMFDDVLGERSSVRLRYTGLFHQSQSFDFTNLDLSVDERISHSAEARIQREAELPTGRIHYGLDAIWTAGEAFDLALAGTSVSQGYARDGLTGRAYFGASGGLGGFEIGYSTESVLSASVSFKVDF